MLELLVSESVMKTDYVKKLIRYKVRNVKIGDTINVEILGVEDEKLGIINLYFDIQDDLESIYNTDEDFSSISMHSLFKIIHNFFYDTDTLPFEVVVFLIKQGYKKEFISDIYYEALLYETKEIYDNSQHIRSIKKRIKEREKAVEQNRCPRCGKILVLRGTVHSFV